MMKNLAANLKIRERANDGLAADLKTQKREHDEGHAKTQALLATSEKKVELFSRKVLHMTVSRDTDMRAEWEPVMQRVIADPDVHEAAVEIRARML